ncbi:unnamed protein product [Rhizophagus irregularis]|nr:unnamed protein product [Rhizophagus irregularis]
MDEKEYDKILKNIEKEEKYIQENGVLYKIKDENKYRVIRRFELEGVMYMMHDHELSAHFGIQATYEKIKEKYWWKNMKRDVEEYVKSCDNCQRRNNPRGLHELHPIEYEKPKFISSSGLSKIRKPRFVSSDFGLRFLGVGYMGFGLQFLGVEYIGFFQFLDIRYIYIGGFEIFFSSWTFGYISFNFQFLISVFGSWILDIWGLTFNWALDIWASFELDFAKGSEYRSTAQKMFVKLHASTTALHNVQPMNFLHIYKTQKCQSYYSVLSKAANAFPVHIDNNQLVGNLKDAIKTKKAPLNGSDKLFAINEIGDYWTETPPKKHIHILVEPPLDRYFKPQTGIT